MKAVYLFVIVLSFFVCGSAVAQKLMVAHVAINPNQGLVWITKDAGFLAKYGLTAEIVLIPGSPRTVQALIAGDLDYAIAGAPAILRARMQGADVVVLSSNSGFSSQRVLLRPDSTVASLSDLKGKIVGVTQYGSAGDSFLRAALKKAGIREADVNILQLGGTPPLTQALDAGKIEVGILGESSALLVFRGRVKPLKGGSSRELGFMALEAPLAITERKLKADRGAVLRFMQANIEAIHYFKTNKPGTVRILQKYLRGLSEEHVGLWYDDIRETLKPLPYPDENALRAELEQINAPKTQPPAHFVNTTILDDIKKSGLIERIYK